MSHNSFVVGSGAGATLESGLAEPMDSRGNIDHGNSISITNTGNKSFSYNGNTGEASDAGLTQHQAGEGVEIHSAGGTPKSYINKGDDVVNYKGMPVQAKVLETMGVLTLNSMGRYEFAPEGEPTKAREPKASDVSNDPHSTFAMSDAENNSINELIPADIAPSALSAITSHGIQGAITGDLKSVVTSFSRSSGQSPEEAQATVSKVIESYSKASERYLAGTVGMNQADIPEFYAWAKLHAPQELKGAVSSMVNKNQFRDLGKLVGQWADSNPPSVDTLEKAGYKIGKSISGDPTVFIQGFGEISVKAAARSKLI